MADHSHQYPAPNGKITEWSRRIDRVWLVTLSLPFVVAVLDPASIQSVLVDATSALAGTAPFVLFAVLAIGWLKATNAENLIASAFEGAEIRMIVVAAAVGGLSPFCSCEVIPFIAALLAAGTPLSAVMAFWLASPLMDPAMFAITAGALGYEFAIAKLLAAVSVAIAGGLATMVLLRGTSRRSVLRSVPSPSCCGGPRLGKTQPIWRFWKDANRRALFRTVAAENAFFLLKWLSLAYVIEALMIRYVPTEAIVSVVGGTGPVPIVLAALIGAPAYLNGYAAPAIASGLLEQGMSQGAAMSFLFAGGVTCIPAAIAVWALVRPAVFGLYLGLGLTGAILSGISWSIWV